MLTDVIVKASDVKAAVLPFSPCLHCKQVVPSVQACVRDEKNRPFCCAGCRAIFNAIEGYDLADYYKIRDQFLENVASAELPSVEFDYLDNPDVQKEFLAGEVGGAAASTEMYFHIAGIQCAACVWILEKIPSIKSEISSVRVDVVKGIAAVRTKNNKFSHFAAVAAQMGYRVHPIRTGDDIRWLQEQNKKTDLKRIAVTAVCAGNIMLLSTSVYLGSDASFTQIFNWVSMGLSVPVIFYGARPLILGAWNALRSRTATLDLPIAVAVLGGFILSVLNVLLGREHVYFDSISALTFLILSSRYITHRLQEKFFSFDADTQGLLPVHAFQKVSASDANGSVTAMRTPVAAKLLKTSDVVHVLKGEKIPVDGKVLSGTAWVRENILTGEAMPRVVQVGSDVFAGTFLESGELIVQVSAVGAMTRIGELQTTATQTAMLKSSGQRLLEKWTERFTWGVVAAGLFTLVYFIVAGEIWTGVERMLSLYIVACPCALAFGVPLLQAKALAVATTKGVYLRAVDVFQRLMQIQNVVFDKTGTLTLGQMNLLEESDELSVDDMRAVLAIESLVQHPVARAIAGAFSRRVNAENTTVENLQLLPGRGVSADVGGHNYAIQTSDRENGSLVIWVDVWRDGEKIGTLGLSDQLRPETLQITQYFKNLGKKIWILSGDKKNNVDIVAKFVDTLPEQTFSRQSPEEKENKIKSIPASIMIGDGVNDAAAMASADIGVIVGGAMERALKASDVFLTQEGLQHLPLLWRLSEQIQKGVGRIRGFSVLYNFLTAGLAVTGHIHPLLAAVLMPVSSIIVLTISYFSVQETQ